MKSCRHRKLATSLGGQITGRKTPTRPKRIVLAGRRFQRIERSKLEVGDPPRERFARLLQTIHRGRTQQEVPACALDSGHMNYNLQLIQRDVRFHGRPCSRAKPTDGKMHCHIKTFRQSARPTVRFRRPESAIARPQRGQGAAKTRPWGHALRADRPSHRSAGARSRSLPGACAPKGPALRPESTAIGRGRSVRSRPCGGTVANTVRVTSPSRSRPRRVRVSMRCDIPPTRRFISLKRFGPSPSSMTISTLHLSPTLASTPLTARQSLERWAPGPVTSVCASTKFVPPCERRARSLI